ncbi:hypothetical protein F5880DRAFT_1671920 [Lentinula raphanica]|nr:hypothetical protein F5880DRAFT_1671920 [Lentinula raphanica]
MPRISKANATYVQQTAAMWHKYDLIYAKHAAIVRTYPDYQDVVKTTYLTEVAPLPVNFMPEDQTERDEFAKQMEECVRTYPNPDNLLDHLRVASAAFFLCRKFSRDIGARGKQVRLETLRAVTALQRAHPYPREPHFDIASGSSRLPLPAASTPSTAAVMTPSTAAMMTPSTAAKTPSTTPTSSSAATTSSAATPSTAVTTSNRQRRRRKDAPERFPLAIPVENPFSWDEELGGISGDSRDENIFPDAQQIQQWRDKPETLPLHQFFIGDVDGNEEAFKVVALTIMASEKLYYVQFVDDEEAVGYTSNDFLDILLQARIVKPN